MLKMCKCCWKSFAKHNKAISHQGHQFASSSTRGRVGTRCNLGECIMSKEECWYNKALYCSSAFASVHHTDDYLWTIRRTSIGPYFGSGGFGLSLSHLSNADVQRKDWFSYKKMQWVLNFFWGFFCLFFSPHIYRLLFVTAIDRFTV